MNTRNQVSASNVWGVDIANTAIKNHRVPSYPAIPINRMTVEPQIVLSHKLAVSHYKQDPLQMIKLQIGAETPEGNDWVKSCVLEKIKEVLPSATVELETKDDGTNELWVNGATLEQVCGAVSGLMDDAKAAATFKEAGEHVQVHLRNYYNGRGHVTGFYEFKNAEEWERAVARARTSSFGKGSS